MIKQLPGQIAANLLLRLDPEYAHALAIRGLGMGLGGKNAPDSPRLAIRAFGRNFANPIGMAAGFDKNASGLKGLGRLGFGFLEAGTVTLRPQFGNPKPRLFRMAEDRAIINRMGFNSKGIEVFCRHLTAVFRPNRQGHVNGPGVPLGINLGINKENADPLRDYCTIAKRVAPYASYLAINLSSPNTPGLRDLQTGAFLSELLDALKKEIPNCPPLVVKLSPDMENNAYPPLVESCTEHGAAGLILTNTTIARSENLQSPHALEKGGLSGRPLARRAREVLHIASKVNQGRLCLISSGGIETGQDILDRLKAGASLVQIYTAFIYQGPTILQSLKTELLAAMAREGFETLSQFSHSGV